VASAAELYLLALRSARPPAATWTDASTNTNANFASARLISVNWTIPAYDAQPGTVYLVEVPFSATMEGNTLELGLSVDNSASFTVNTTLSASIVGAGVGVNGTMRLKLQVLTTGTGGTYNAFVGGDIHQSGAATTFANSGSLAGSQVLGGSVDTTVSHTMAAMSLWGATTTGQVVAGYGSTFTRSGR
jgi:hypothetical protein